MPRLTGEPARPGTLHAGVLMLAALLVVAGCATPAGVAPVPSVQSPAARYFELSARLSLRAGQQVDIVNLRWTREAAGEVIQLLSPLGSTVARLQQPAGGEAVLEEGGGATRRAPDIASLVESVLGQPVPIAEIGWWIQGWQAGGLSPLPPGEFRHAQWRVTADHAPDGRVSHLLAVREDLRVRLVLDRFEARP